MKLFQFAMVVFALGAAGTSRADLYSADSSFGPNSLTIDTSSQLAWLDLTYSVSYSYSQAEVQMQSGGQFAGFRHATTSEVLGLFNAAGIPATGLYPVGNGGISTLFGLVGTTASDGGNAEVIGISGTPGGAGVRYVPMVEYGVFGGFPAYDVSTQKLAYSDFLSDAGVGNWLVTAVPEPNVAALVLLSGRAIGLARRVRRGR